MNRHSPPHAKDAGKIQIEELDGIGFPHTLIDWLDRDLPEPERIMGEWLTTTTKVILTAPTGLGKTHFVMAMGIHAAAGIDFLHWRSHRKFRVLYFDGEMSRRLLAKRLKAAVKRLSLNPHEIVFYALSHEDIPNLQPLNSEAGREFILDFISKKGGVDLAIFDNIMALTIGDMRDSEAWQLTLPLVSELTKKETGQIWVHHTGHDTTRGYGDKTREWRIDTTIFLTGEKRPDTDVSFTLKFEKARERTPETRRDFDDVTIALLNDEWTRSEPSKKRKELSPKSRKFLDAFRNAVIGAKKYRVQTWEAIKIDDWHAECVKLGLIDPKKKPDSARAQISKYRLELIVANHIACNDDLVWEIK